MKAYRGSGGIVPYILDLGTRWREWSASRHGRFTPREGDSGTNWIGGWVGPRAGLDAVAKRKILNPSRDLEHPIIQPVVERYTTELFRLVL
jgi:hypothetical protein